MLAPSLYINANGWLINLCVRLQKLSLVANAMGNIKTYKRFENERLLDIVSVCVHDLERFFLD